MGASCSIVKKKDGTFSCIPQYSDQTGEMAVQVYHIYHICPPHPWRNGEAECPRDGLQVQLVNVVDVLERVRRVSQEVRPVRLRKAVVAKNRRSGTRGEYRMSFPSWLCCLYNVSQRHWYGSSYIEAVPSLLMLSITDIGFSPSSTTTTCTPSAAERVSSNTRSLGKTPVFRHSNTAFTPYGTQASLQEAKDAPFSPP